MELFSLPFSTNIQRVVAKNLFESYLNSDQKAMLTNDIAKIKWTNKISNETTNIPHREIEEIQIFSIELKVKKDIDIILEIIDKTIPYHIIFIVFYGDELYLSASSKHPSPLNPNKSIIEWTYTSPWFKKSDNLYKLNLKKDIDTVFFDFCLQLSQNKNNRFKNIEDLSEFNARVSSLKKEISKLKKKINACPHFNKKVEFNLDLIKLEDRLNKITNI